MKWVWFYYSVSTVKLAILSSKYMVIPSVRREICGPPYMAKPLIAIPSNILSNADTESYTSITSGGQAHHLLQRLPAVFDMANSFFIFLEMSCQITTRFTIFIF